MPRKTLIERVSISGGSNPQAAGGGSQVVGCRSQVVNNICKLIMSFQKNRFHNYDLKSKITGQTG